MDRQDPPSFMEQAVADTFKARWYAALSVDQIQSIANALCSLEEVQDFRPAFVKMWRGKMLRTVHLTRHGAKVQGYELNI